MDEYGWEPESHWDTTELISDLRMCEDGSRVQAMTPHGTYRFNIVGMRFDRDGGITLALQEAPK